MKTLTVILLLALSGCSFFHGERLGKPLKNRKTEQPVAQWIQALQASETKGCYRVWSDQIHGNLEAFKPGARKEFCKEFLDLYAGLWFDEFSGAKDGDFTYSFADYDTKDEFTVLNKGKEVDPRLIGPLPVVLENGSWKITQVPSP